jgi:hypothetical protein
LSAPESSLTEISGRLVEAAFVSAMAFHASSAKDAPAWKPLAPATESG